MSTDYLKNNFFKIYIISIFFCSIIILYNKFLYPTDWTTSEWLINYHGGFVRRGLTGELILLANTVVETNPRNLVFIFGILILLTYYTLIIRFIKKIDFSPLLILIIFSPLGFIYPIAEIETLARKEILFFCIYIIFLTSLIHKNLKLTFFIIIFLIPLMNLIWDGMIFYLFFFVFSYLNYKKNLKIKELVFFLLSFIPYLVSLYFVIMTKATQESMTLMCSAIGEPCFGAMNFLDQSLKFQINYGVSKFKLEYLIRHLAIFSVCFFPIIILFKNKNNLFYQYIICVIPTFLFFYISYDWGRYLNILYTFSMLTLIFFIKNNTIDISNISLNKFLVKLSEKKKFILYGIFFCYLFSWNTKAIMSDDIGSFPYIRIIDRIIEYIN